MKTGKKRFGVPAVLAAVCVLLAACALMAIPASYPASDAALEACALGIRDGNATVFEPEETRAAMIFYPGGRVEHQAYASLMRALSDRGILCLLVQMPMDLAVLDMDAAEALRERYADRTDVWLIGGHSLGGAMAASHLKESAQDYEGLVLLGAYAADDLSDTALRVLSVYGSEDGVMNREKYAQSLAFYPPQFTELVLPGGNHANFGSYGAQRGDGEASITREEQIAYTADAIADMIR